MAFTEREIAIKIIPYVLDRNFTGKVFIDMGVRPYGIPFSK
jgi:hypothetical protein